MTNGSKKVFDYLRSVYPQEMTAQEIVAAINDPEVKIGTVTGCVNSLVKKEYAVRNESTVKDEVSGKDKTIKHIVLTEAGMSYDPVAEEEAKAAAKATAKAEKEAARAAAKAAKEAE